MSYKRKIRIRPKQPTFGLNITSMSDMFTMLLVFLLQSFATSHVEIFTEPGAPLPVSSSLVNPTHGTQVMVGKNEVRIDGQVVLTLEGGSPKASDVDPGSKTISPLLAALKERAEKAKSEPAKAEVDTTSVLLVADSTRDMAQLKPYLNTISAAGFAKVKLATVVGR